MKLQKNGRKISTSDIMFFLCDHEGNIYEISESCKTILGLTNNDINANEINLDNKGPRLNIQDIVPEISISNLKMNDPT